MNIVNPEAEGRRVKIAPGKCLNSRHLGKIGTIREPIRDGRVRVYWEGGHHKKVTYMVTDLVYLDPDPTPCVLPTDCVEEINTPDVLWPSTPSWEPFS